MAQSPKLTECENRRQCRNIVTLLKACYIIKLLFKRLFLLKVNKCGCCCFGFFKTTLQMSTNDQQDESQRTSASSCLLQAGFFPSGAPSVPGSSCLIGPNRCIKPRCCTHPVVCTSGCGCENFYSVSN